jgi:hypothetical protein
MFDRTLQVEAIPGYPNRWIVLRPFNWVERGRVINVPANFITDFGSIPLILMGLLLGNGADYAQCYTLHDKLYRDPGKLTRLQCDAILDRAMKKAGAGWAKRKAIRLGLLIGGWRTWARYRAKDGLHYDP